MSQGQCGKSFIKYTVSGKTRFVQGADTSRLTLCLLNLFFDFFFSNCYYFPTSRLTHTDRHRQTSDIYNIYNIFHPPWTGGLDWNVPFSSVVRRIATSEGRWNKFVRFVPLILDTIRSLRNRRGAVGREFCREGSLFWVFNFHKINLSTQIFFIKRFRSKKSTKIQVERHFETSFFPRICIYIWPK